MFKSYFYRVWCNGLVTSFCCFFILTAQGQGLQSDGNTSVQQKPLPGLKDWFLSTGNWENDPQLYVREFGTGPDTIIMLHGGWGAEHSELLTAVIDLKEQFHFIFYDQRGSLRSPCPDSLISFSHHIEDVELLRKELNIDKLNIVGHSMGAVLASAYAQKYPQHTNQLILLAPMYLKQPIPEEETALQQKGGMEMQAFMNRPAVRHELELYSLHRNTPPLSSREETTKFRINIFGRRMLYDISKWPEIMGGRALFKGNVFELTARTYPASGWDYIQEFQKQAYPVSIIVGDHDFLDFNNYLVKEWVNEVSKIQLTVIENAGHLLWLDQPNAFTKQLAMQLKR